MDKISLEELKENLVDIETIQIALNDKLHKVEEQIAHLKPRIELLKKMIEE